MKLTDDLILVPRVRGGHQVRPYRVTLSMPNSDPTGRITLSEVTRELANWQNVTHVQVRASLRAFVLIPCTGDAMSAIPLVKRAGSTSARAVMVGAIDQALCLKPGERFHVETEMEGQREQPLSIIGEWPEVIRYRMAAPTQLRRVS